MLMPNAESSVRKQDSSGVRECVGMVAGHSVIGWLSASVVKNASVCGWASVVSSMGAAVVSAVVNVSVRAGAKYAVIGGAVSGV